MANATDWVTGLQSPAGRIQVIAQQRDKPFRIFNCFLGAANLGKPIETGGEVFGLPGQNASNINPIVRAS
jgi:hypothetical protein